MQQICQNQPQSMQNQINKSNKQIISVIPQKYIVFQCEDDQPMGQIRINLINPTNSNSQFEFQLMCTNKQNYKVTNCKGTLNKQNHSYLIRIYIKNIDNLQKCLSDKFRIRIYDINKPNKELMMAKLKVLIQKHKQPLKIDQITNNLTQTASRTASLYTNPSAYLNPSALASTTATDVKSIIYYSRILANQQKKITPLQQKQQTLADFKLQFDQSNQKFFNKQKQLKTAQNNYQKNKAKQKLCFGLVILVFLMSILIGFLGKRLIKSDMWHNFYDYVKNQYFN